MKKSYNPFKMWGSWVCLVITFLLFIYIGLECSFDGCSFRWTNFLWRTFGVFLIPLGFFLGWGIHSLIRSLRR
jgi:hypothetical protein